jgi:hypothetical protein
LLSARNRRRDDPPPVAGGRLHPDVVIGAMSEVLQGLAHPVSNTLADVGTYVRRPLEELFPERKGLPEVTVRGRWRLPGLSSEDRVFRSLHVPIEPKFRRDKFRPFLLRR